MSRTWVHRLPQEQLRVLVEELAARLKLGQAGANAFLGEDENPAARAAAYAAALAGFGFNIDQAGIASLTQEAEAKADLKVKAKAPAPMMPAGEQEARAVPVRTHPAFSGQPLVQHPDDAQGRLGCALCTPGAAGGAGQRALPEAREVREVVAARGGNPDAGFLAPPSPPIATAPTPSPAPLQAPQGWRLVILHNPKSTPEFLAGEGWRRLRDGTTYDKKVKAEQVTETVNWARQRGRIEVKDTTPPSEGA